MDDLLHGLPQPDGQGFGEDLVLCAMQGYRAPVFDVLQVTLQEGDDTRELAVRFL